MNDRVSWVTKYKEEIKFIRFTILMGLGIWILVHETLYAGADRPLRILAGLALCGLEGVLRLDEWIKRK